MKFRYYSLLILFLNLYQSQTWAIEKSSPPAPEIKEGLKKIESRLALMSDEKCEKISFTSESQKITADPCKDLFEAACYNGEEAHYAKALENLGEESEKNISLAFSAGIKEHGFSSAVDFFVAQYKEDGIDLDPVTVKNVLENDSIQNFSISTFNDVAECEKVNEQINEDRKKITDDEKLKEKEKEKKLLPFVKKEKEMALKYIDKIKKVYLADLKYFFMEGLDKQCETYRKNSTDYPKQLNSQAEKYCSNLKMIRYEAIDLLRKEKHDSKAAQAFVNKYFIPPLKGENYETNLLKNTCESLSNKFSSYNSEKSKKIKKMLLATKSTIEFFNKVYFEGEKFESVKKTAKEVIDGVKNILPGIISDQAKREKITKEYDQVSLFKLNNPPLSFYKKLKSGAYVLDSDAIPATNDDYSSFFDDKLTFFTEFNASYSPMASVGTVRKPQTIVINPKMILKGAQHPLALLDIMAHEVGHKLGPDISLISGHPLKEELGSAFQCLKSEKSIALKPNQYDEATGDLIAAEVLARKLLTMDKKDRKRALYTAMSGFCMFSTDKTTQTDYDDVHPDPLLRVSGIFGANPNIRMALGCSGESKKFKTCGLKGEKK